MMGWSPKRYISSFVKIGLSVLEKEIFEWFYHICDPDFAIKEILDDGRRTDGRRTDWYTISSPCEPSAQVR